MDPRRLSLYFLSSGAPTGSDALQEICAFMRGLRTSAYGIDIHPLQLEAMRTANPPDGILPALVLDGKLLCAGRVPTAEEVSDLLRLGCEDTAEGDDCCKEALSLTGDAQARQETDPDVVCRLARAADPSANNLPVVVDEDQCPRSYPFATWHFRWPFDDPTTVTGSQAERLAAFRRVRDGIRDRIESWLNTNDDERE